MKRNNQCYFCETVENVNCRLYVSSFVGGRYTPTQVAVCESCKTQYESFYHSCDNDN